MHICFRFSYRRSSYPTHRYLLAWGQNCRRCGVQSNRSRTGWCSVLLLRVSLRRHLPQNNFDLLVVPGGFTGAQTLSKSSGVQHLIREYLKNGKYVGMICAGQPPPRSSWCASEGLYYQAPSPRSLPVYRNNQSHPTPASRTSWIRVSALVPLR